MLSLAQRLLVPMALFASALPATAQIAKDPATRQLEREILAQLIEINTSDSAGGTPVAAKAMAERLTAAGIPSTDVRVLGAEPRYQNLVARLRGRDAGKKPVLLMAHLDVVDARKEDWTTDPYRFVEKDGWYYGRGTSDNKAGAAMLVANLIRYKREGFIPERDIIVVLTADEETTGNSIAWLVREHRDLIDADYALNTDGGGGDYRDWKPVRFNVQAAEKVYQSFALEVRNKGGHSSRPVPDNAISHLSRALVKIADYEFPAHLGEVTKMFFERSAGVEPPAIAADMRAVAGTGNAQAARRLADSSPYYNATLRTTCVATRLFAGHADNALPQLARATVNCRIMPNESVDSVEARLKRAVGDTAVHFSRAALARPSPPSPLRADIMEPIEALAAKYWPGIPVIPEMSTGATDGLYTRNAGIPTYGVAAIFDDMNDSRAHGRDERVGVKEYHLAAEYWYEMVKRLTAGKPAS
ncbi:MAG: M20/M25/M40 family metallo-hydrolase [Gemmatimonadales bacterium]|nr:M20/M25/M40 family metallo-hydrolase [Gemmatimonadales bacterium]